MGEDVYNLQIFLGYQHRGVEREIAAADGFVARQVALCETCAGDTSIAAATCFADIMESAFPKRFAAPSANALAVRRCLLELERIANHVGDLGALAGDVAFLPTSSFCGRIRGDYLNMTALVCGNRFGRNAVVPGGARATIDAAKAAKLKSLIAAAKKDLDNALSLMFNEPTVVERFSGTGVVTKETAAEIGLVGVARRASDEFGGDVLARAKVRRVEIDEAHEKIAAILDALETGRSPETGSAAKVSVRSAEGGFKVCVSTVAAWRGPLVHAALFADDGKMLRYKIVDPSAFNWHGLAWALRGEQISNFPICNKSFNLSYCGTDR
jgi:Ni,Fe-hydrogenase III large subunit